MARKGNGTEAKLSYSGHILMDNRNGMVADVEVLQANGTAERDAALVMIERIEGNHQVTVGGDKNYDTKNFVADTRSLNVTPHVAQKGRSSALDGRTKAARRIRNQPSETQGDRRNLRLDEDGGRDAETAASGTSVGGLEGMRSSVPKPATRGQRGPKALKNGLRSPPTAWWVR